MAAALRFNRLPVNLAVHDTAANQEENGGE